MLKQIVTLESVIEGKVGQFLLAHDTDIRIARNMCEQFMKYFDAIEEHAKKQQAQSENKEDVAQKEVDNG